MVCWVKKDGDFIVVDVDAETSEKILKEAENYRLVKTRTITWERLDDDRYGEDTDEFVYSLTEKNESSIDFCLVIENGHFIGVKVYSTVTTSWNAGLNKEQSLCGCLLYIDGKTEGTVTSRSSYDSPNNHDDVETTYSLRKIS